MKILLAVGLLLASFNLKASVIYYNYACKFTMVAQDTAGGTTATKYRLDTKTMLQYIAEAEFYSGGYEAASFPVGSRLVYQFDTDAQTGGFVVQDVNRNVICDVSDVVWLEFSGSAVQLSTTTSVYQEVFHYDSTGAGLNLQFQSSYLTTEAVKSGIHTCKGTSGTGSGDLGGRTLVFTGSCSSTTK